MNSSFPGAKCNSTFNGVFIILYFVSLSLLVLIGDESLNVAKVQVKLRTSLEI